MIIELFPAPPADIPAVPPESARAYIADMLTDLCAIAKQSGQDDLHDLLNMAKAAAALG